MKTKIMFLIIFAMTTFAYGKIDLVTLPDRDTVQLTIYNSADMTLVRETRYLTLKEGDNKLQFSWENTLIDPTSLQMLPKASADKIELSELTYPSRVKNVGVWNIQSEISGKVPVEITYLTSGIGWRASYMGTLTKDERTMHLEGFVTVDNKSGEEYADAQTRLIVGKVHLLDEIAQLAQRQYPYGRPLTERYSGMAGGRSDKLSEIREGVLILGDMPELKLFGAAEKLDRKEIRKEGLSEYFLYTIGGTETIPNNWQKRLPSLEAKDVPVEHLYKYDEDRFGTGVVRFLSFKNDEKHKLGQTPIPGGLLKVYRTVDETGHLAFTGQSAFKYIPVDDDVELNLGAVEDVVVKPVLMNYETANYTFDRKKDISGWDEITTWKIEVRNTRQLEVKVEITRGFNTNYWNIHTDQKGFSYEKHDAEHARFKQTIPPRSNKAIVYKLTTYHGTRQQQATR